MYTELDESTENAIGYKVQGDFTEADFEAVARDMEAVIDEYGDVRLLIEYVDIPRPELEMMDDDVAFWLQHRDDLERYAIVGDSTLLEWASTVSDRLGETEVKHFESSENEAAWRWLRA